MRKATAAVLPVLVLAALALQAALPVPRQTPDFTIKVPGQNPVTLSSLKGKVVVMQFLFTSCSHCMETATMLGRVRKDFAAKGVEVYGIAFNDEVHTSNAAKNAAEAANFSAKYGNFPVGIADRDAVMKFLGLSPMQRWGVPQIVVIDKKGVIQAQSKVGDGPEPLQHEPSVRNLLTMLAK